MMPSLTSTKETAKFAPKAVLGIFLGYAIQAGGKFTGDYHCMTIEDCAAARTTQGHCSPLERSVLR